MDSSTTSSLHGGADTKKTLLIMSTVFFAVGVVLLIVILTKKSPSQPVQANVRSARIATELNSEAEARAALGGPDPTMVFLSATWCGFCKKAAPIYDQLASDPAYSHVKLLKLDAGKASGLAKEKGVSGFPTFLTNWGEGKHVGFKDLPKMRAILDTAKRRSRLNAGTSEAEVVRALQGKDPVVVFLSAEGCGYCKRMIPVWEEASGSGKFNHINMIHIEGKNARELVKANGVTGFPTFLSNRGEGKYVGFRPKEQFEQMLVTIGKV